MTTNISSKPEAQAVAEIVELLTTPTPIALDDADEPADLIFVSKGIEVVDLKKFRDARRAAPERRTGTAKLTDLSSFVAYVNRFADEHSAIFALDNPSAPKLTAVLDYHEKTAAGAPRFGVHRAEYSFPLSDEWKAWKALESKPALGQSDFAAALEDRIVDVLEPGAAGDAIAQLAAQLGIKLAGPSSLLTVSRGLAVHVDQNVLQAVNLSTGETSLAFEETHRDRSTGGKLDVPGGFAIGIPVFRSGHRYSIGVRLRYRLREGKVTWSIVLHRTDVVFDDAFREACSQAQRETGVPMFFGTPES